MLLVQLLFHLLDELKCLLRVLFSPLNLNADLIESVSEFLESHLTSLAEIIFLKRVGVSFSNKQLCIFKDLFGKLRGMDI